MNTRKNELYTAAELENFSKIEVIDKYVLLAIKYETMADNLERMEEFLRLANHSAYGASSEKRLDADQLNFFDRIPNGVFNEAEAIAEETEKQEQQAQPRARRMVGEVGAHKSCFDHLPVEEVLHDLDDPNCPHCHSQLKELKTVEKRTEIVLIPARLVKRRHMEKVYVCDHCQETGEHSPIIESPTPLPVLSGSYVSASLMAYIMAKKYWEKTPIYRLETQFKSAGYDISRAVMANWIIKGSQLYMEGLYEALYDEIKKSAVIHVDETPVQVLQEEGRRAQQKSYMWVYVNGLYEPQQVRLYEYQPTRSAQHPIRFLDGYKSYLQSDGYAGYKKVPDVTLIGCMAHAKRKFVEVTKSLGKNELVKGTLAEEALTFFDKLFYLEHQFAEMSPEMRYKARLEHSKPLFEAYKTWLQATQKKVTAKSGLGSAITYNLNQWDYRENFLKDGRLEITNNRAERAIKEFVIGRKNFLFSTSVKGVVASQVLYSIVETAKANSLHPYEYLKYVIEELSQNRHTPEKIQEVLPWSDKIPAHIRIKND
ncbi:MAG: IS66 family transposase [Clostridiaceae bacterium]